MKLTGLHLLLTYKCNFECDHCFVWGSPWQRGTMTLDQIETILNQARELGTVEWIYFEGGEPYLFYPILLRGVRKAAELGFRVGIVTNAYWATAHDDALEWLRPFAGEIDDLSISNDTFHGGDIETECAVIAGKAAQELVIPVATIGICRPDTSDAAASPRERARGEFGVCFRGRAATKLVQGVRLEPSEGMVECPGENLRDPGRIHVDPFGHLHVCQGISIGNLFERSLREVWEGYDPDRHPVIGPLLRGGPVALADDHDVPRADGYADACHLCYETRQALRTRFGASLAPDAMYGIES
jgi:MoaA/NifB/PqqE/SkfB family radical SAM enzyme